MGAGDKSHGSEIDHLQDRENAVKILVRVEEGAFADRLLDKANPAVRALVKGVLQERGAIDEELSQYLHRGIEDVDPKVLAILRCGALQIMFNPELHKALVVNESVILAKNISHRGTAGVVNAVLRKVRVSPLANKVGAFDKNFPGWILTRWRSFWGEDTASAVAKSLCEKPKLFFRTNTILCTSEELVEALREDGVTAFPSRDVPESLEVVLGDVKELLELEAYKKGLFSVQDLSETLVGRILNPRPGERILDMCAGPGGKTSHLCQLSEGRAEVVALDLNAKRAELVRKNLTRLGCSGAEVLETDALSYSTDKLFDKVLLDGPCSGSGVFNKKVDSRWKLQEPELQGLIELQAKLLRKALSLVRPGGKVVYSTCSLEADENDRQIAKLLESDGAVVVDSLPETLAAFISKQPTVSFLRCGLTTYPHIHGCAGGFVSVISRL